MAKIKQIDAYEVLDSRGFPTVAAEVVLDNGTIGSSIVPSGASTGSREALELRDGGDRYFGKGVKTATHNIQRIIQPVLLGRSAEQQIEIDHALISLDSTSNKSNLGANSILAVSLAIAHASANSQKIPLYQYIHQIFGYTQNFVMPVPLVNVINGGAHADNNLDVQEFMLIPHGAPTFAEAIRYAVETFYALKKILRTRGYSTGVGDEGGFAPSLKDNIEVLDCLMEAIMVAGFKPGRDISLGLDVAASELYVDGVYRFAGLGVEFSSDGLVDYYEDLVERYPIISLEDGLAEDDWVGWELLTRRLGARLQLVGDDLFVTDVQLLRRGIDEGVANAVLIKLNQIGTLTQTMEAIGLAQESGYGVVVSHRSGESEDATIADLALGACAWQIKTGSVCRGERTAKYNRLLRIEQQLGERVRYAGVGAFKRIG
jgi:enolase